MPRGQKKKVTDFPSSGKPTQRFGALAENDVLSLFANPCLWGIYSVMLIFLDQNDSINDFFS